MDHTFPCVSIQEAPLIIVAAVPGRWLLKRTSPSWRIEDPEAGFQRMVSEKRARLIAAGVLDQHRTFPNAIVLATDLKEAKIPNGSVHFPRNIKFLVVDGQHRLWAQRFSEYEAEYACLIHFGLHEREMAALFIEINDNQKRVPSSLRWDLVRLVRPEEDEISIRAADLVYDLANVEESALRQRIDLTGEQSEISLKQGSVAPAIRTAIAMPRSKLRNQGYDIQLEILINYISAIRERDADGWDKARSTLYSARVFRALFRLLPDLLDEIEKPVNEISAADFFPYLKKIKLRTLDPERIRAQQGTASIKAIYDTIRD